MPPTPQSYKYTFETQAEMIALLFQNPEALPRLHGSLQPEYFTDYHLGVISREILTYFKEFGTVPNIHHIRDRLISLAGMEKAQGVVDCLDKIGQIQIKNSTDVEVKIWKFGQRQSVFKALQDILDLAKEDKDLTPSIDLIRHAIFNSGSVFDPGIDFKATLKDLFRDIKSSALYNPTLKVPFGDLHRFNTMTRGGIGEGELYVVAAPPKRGKTSLLTYIGAMAVLRGHDVLHISLESKVLDCRINYTSLFTGWTRNQIADAQDPSMTDSLLNTVLPHISGELRIAYFPPESITIEQLRSHIMRLRTAYNFKPHLLIIDYPDRMKLDAPQDLYNSLGRLYDRIISMLDDLKMRGLIATQLGRGSIREDSPGAEYVTDSWKKIANLDGLIIIEQTKGEIVTGEARLNLDKNRRGVPGGVVRVIVDHSRCLWKEIQQ